VKPVRPGPFVINRNKSSSLKKIAGTARGDAPFRTPEYGIMSLRIFASRILRLAAISLAFMALAAARSQYALSPGDNPSVPNAQVAGLRVTPSGGY
jgi:hypothetical protein